MYTTCFRTNHTLCFSINYACYSVRNVISAVASVVLAEMFNTCIEKTCDLYTTEMSEKVRVIKDLAAGTVLCSAIYAVCVAVLVIVLHFGG